MSSQGKSAKPARLSKSSGLSAESRENTEGAEGSAAGAADPPSREHCEHLLREWHDMLNSHVCHVYVGEAGGRLAQLVWQFLRWRDRLLPAVADAKPNRVAGAQKCPVCQGATTLSLGKRTSPISVVCTGRCGLYGPSASTRAAAVRAWNRLSYRWSDSGHLPGLKG